MPDTLASALVTAKNTLHQLNPWAWLVEADADGTNGFYLVGYDASISYGGKLYEPAPIIVGVIEQSGEGDLPRIEITVGNAGREASTRLDNGELIDRSCLLRLVNTSNLTVHQDWGEWRIIEAQVRLQSVVFSLGPYDLIDSPYPAVRQHRSRCSKVYGGLECQYDLTLPNNIAGTQPNFDPTKCDLGLDTDNGCIAHGDNEIANGRPRKHPGRFGGFPGIPKGPAR